MAKPLLNLCRVPPLADRDGNTGGIAHIFLPFYGYWYASGQIYPFTHSIAQDKSRTISGTRMINNYQKDCGCCGVGGGGTPDIEIARGLN